MNRRARLGRLRGPRGPLLLALAVGATPATAASQHVDVLQWSSDTGYAASFHQDTVRYAPALAVYDYSAVFKALVAELERSPRWTHAEPAYRNLHWAAGEIARRFGELDVELAQSGDVGGAVDRFLASTPTGLFQEVNQGWFDDAHRVTFDDVGALPDSQALDFLERRHAIEALLTKFRKPARERTLAAIHRAADRWRTFVEHGRSAYPWEVWVNDRRPFRASYDIEHPPRRQWIVAHPELGVEVQTTGCWLDEATASEALLVQILGHVWYRWSEPARPGAGLTWYGLSLVSTLRDDIGPGFGLTALYGPAITVGALWHDEGRPGRWVDHPPRLVLGVDLYRLARPAREEVPRALERRSELVTALLRRP